MAYLDRFALTLLCSVASWGCQADGDPAAEENAPDALAEAACDATAACNCRGLEDVSRSQCVSETALFFDAVASMARERGLTYDGGCVERALDEANETRCDQPPDLFPTEVCKLYFGPKSEGQACTVDFLDDCAQGLVCMGSTCRDPAFRASEGEPCIVDELFVPCADDLRCALSFDTDAGKSTGQCERLAQLGESCMELQCADGLDCAPGETDSMCITAPSEGEPCRSECAQGLGCQATGGPATCVPLLAEGAACGTDDECASDDCENDVCLAVEDPACVIEFGF